MTQMLLKLQVTSIALHFDDLSANQKYRFHLLCNKDELHLILNKTPRCNNKDEFKNQAK